MRTLAESLELPLLVTKAANLRYLTGYVGTNGYLLVEPSRATFVTDGRYSEIVEGLMDSIDGSDVVVYTEGLEATLGGLFAGDITVESEAVTLSFANALAKECSGEIIAGGGAVELLRRIKDDAEVAHLRRAAGAGDAAFEEVLGLAASAGTEREMAWALVTAMKREGGDVADWDPIVAVGANASRPHHETGESSLGDGLLLVDYGCVVNGYHSDMSRTIWLGGGEPDGDLLTMYDAVLAAQEAAIATVGPGVPAGEVDKAARGVLDAAGLGETFLHSTGHGVGLEIHEEPWVRKGSEHELEPGNVITVEPGAYVPGVGGVRIEDMILVTDGGAEVLTGSTKALR